jgi:hypothetical protein
MSELATATTQLTRPDRSRAAVRAAWADRIARFGTSGLSPAAFCAAEGVSLPAFYSWKRRLASPLTTDGAATGLPLLPVRLAEPTTAIEVALPTGAVLRLGCADEATLRCLLRLLGALPC